MTRLDGISVQVQLAMYLDEGHRATVASEDGKCGRAQVFAPQRLSVGCNRRDGRRTTTVRHAEPVHDVFGVDAGPHHDAHIGEAGSYVRELSGQGPLGIVELGSPVEQGRALRVEDGELPRTMRDASVAGRKANGGHKNSPDRELSRGNWEAKCPSAAWRARAAAEDDRIAPVRHLHPSPLHKTVLKILAKNLQHGLRSDTTAGRAVMRRARRV